MAHAFPLLPSSFVMHVLVNRCLSVCLSDCLSVCLSVCLSAYYLRVFFTHGLRYNYRLIFFRGPWAIFKDSFHLRDDYRDGKRRLDVARRWVGWQPVCQLREARLMVLCSACSTSRHASHAVSVSLCLLCGCSLQNYIAVVALVNLIFSPLILVYQILHSFFTYAEVC